MKERLTPGRSLDFGKSLMHTLETYGISAYRLAEDSGIDRAYISRLTRGISTSPGKTIVMKIGYGLAKNSVPAIELDHLLIAAGYAPAFNDWKPVTTTVG